MSDGYVAADGRRITDEMIGRWCEAYERGEFPEGERSSGAVVAGRPPRSPSGMAVISVELPVGMKAALEREAAGAGVSAGAYVRDALADRLLATA